MDDLTTEMVGREQPKSSLIDKVALGTYLGGTAADVGSTAYFQSHPKLGITEQNPLINWAPTKAQLPIGMAMEGLTGVLLNKALKNHPNWRRAAMIGAGAIHTGLAANNMRLIHNSQQALQDGNK